LAACADVLSAEGVQIVGPAEGSRADIVVSAMTSHPAQALTDVDAPDVLYDGWDDLVTTVGAYQGALDHMRAQGWGRLVGIGTAQAKSLDSVDDELGAVVTLGLLGLHKVVTSEIAHYGITANAVLHGGAATVDDVAATVAFLCSTGASYLDGVTITVDGGAGSGMF
jgi:3-oxoacyl-[acyl-carrier protein] reductase